jgi:hypothetical protein
VFFEGVLYDSDPTFTILRKKKEAPIGEITTSPIRRLRRRSVSENMTCFFAQKICNTKNIIMLVCAR